MITSGDQVYVRTMGNGDRDSSYGAVERRSGSMWKRTTMVMKL